MPIAAAIAEVTTVEWVKEAHRVQREATLGRGGGQSTETESRAAPTELAPNQGNPPVDPTTQLHPSTSLANMEEVPQ
jgi:hypothetical protein